MLTMQELNELASQFQGEHMEYHHKENYGLQVAIGLMHEQISDDIWRQFTLAQLIDIFDSRMSNRLIKSKAVEFMTDQMTGQTRDFSDLQSIFRRAFAIDNCRVKQAAELMMRRLISQWDYEQCEKAFDEYSLDWWDNHYARPIKLILADRIAQLIEPDHPREFRQWSLIFECCSYLRKPSDNIIIMNDLGKKALTFINNQDNWLIIGRMFDLDDINIAGPRELTDDEIRIFWYGVAHNAKHDCARTLLKLSVNRLLDLHPDKYWDWKDIYQFADNIALRESALIHMVEQAKSMVELICALHHVKHRHELRPKVMGKMKELIPDTQAKAEADSDQNSDK